MPTGFLWGVSTSAHQVEGDNGNSQWSLWEAAGRIKSGEHCGQACDWWRNAERDFDLARGLGLNAMRLSVVLNLTSELNFLRQTSFKFNRSITLSKMISDWMTSNSVWMK